MKFSGRRLRIETLEVRQVMSTSQVAWPQDDVAQAVKGDPGVIVVPFDPLAVTDMEVMSLPPHRYTEIAPNQIHLMKREQIELIFDGLLTTGGWPSQSFRPTQITPIKLGFQPEQIRWLIFAGNNINPMRLDLGQREYISAEQIETMSKGQFVQIPTSRVQYLTQVQVDSLTDGDFAGWLYRDGLTQSQVAWIDLNKIFVNRLSPQQKLWLTPEQLGSMPLGDLKHLPAAKIPEIPPARLGQIDHETLAAWSSDQLMALTPAQVQSLNMTVIHITLLKPEQREWLTVEQLESLPLPLLQYLPVAQIPRIPVARIAAIHDREILGSWTPAMRAALTIEQVQVVDVTISTISLLTEQQRDWLTDAQLAVLPFDEWRHDAFGIYLKPEQIRRVPASVFAKLPESTDLHSLTNWQQTGYTREQLFSLGTMTAGDFDQDGAIDGADLATRWAANFGRTDSGQAQGDADGNAIVDGNDFLMWQRRNGRTPGANMWDNYMSTETTQKAPVGGYTPFAQLPIAADGLPDAPHIRKERDALFALVPAGFQTHTAIASGKWSSTDTWGGAIPGPGAKVLIPADVEVTYDHSSTDVLSLMRVNGTLKFAHDANTLLVIDTIVVDTNGTLHIGTEQQPIGDAYTARIEFPFDSPINETWDPTLVSRGLLSRGHVRMFGKEVTPFLPLGVQPLAGAEQLELSEAPTNWNPGDKLVIAGTDVGRDDFGVEERTIRSIAGNVVTLDRPLERSHTSPMGYGFQVHVANLKRNIEFGLRGGMDPQMVSPSMLPHIFFLHNPDVQIENIHVNGFGRTDKTRRIVEPAEAHHGSGGSGGGHLAVNPRGRYAIHFHHTGVNAAIAPRSIRGSALENGPGWGYVNHQSFVEMENNFAYKFSGAGFVTEDGNEIGLMKGNLSIGNSGLTGVSTNPADGEVRARADIHDFGHSGNGFWLQGPGVKLINNIANATAGPAFAVFGGTNKVLFDAANLPSPELAGGRGAVPVDSVPLSEFVGNTSYGVQGSFDLWYIASSMPAVAGHTSVVDSFTSWTQRLGAVAFHYTKDLTVDNAVLIGNRAAPQELGVALNSGMENFTIQNSEVRGFEVGVMATSRGKTNIEWTVIEAVNSVKIGESFDDLRKIVVGQHTTFVTLTPAQLAGRQQKYFYMEGSFSFDYPHLTYWAATAPVDIQVHMPGVGWVKLYFKEQAATHTPFSTTRSAPETAAVQANIPSQYWNKTNAQLWVQYGVAYASEVAPTSALIHPLINGLYTVLPVQETL